MDAFDAVDLAPLPSFFFFLVLFEADFDIVSDEVLASGSMLDFSVGGRSAAISL